MPRPGHDVGDGVGDVLGLQAIDAGVAAVDALEDLGTVVARELGLDRTGLDEAARASAVASPMPELAPVTSAVAP